MVIMMSDSVWNFGGDVECTILTEIENQDALYDMADEHDVPLPNIIPMSTVDEWVIIELDEPSPLHSCGERIVTDMSIID